MAVRNFLQGEATLHIFPQIRSGAGMDSLKSAWRDQAENPESYVAALSTICPASIARIQPQESARCRDRAFGANARGECARVRISSVDILPPGFGDANVATKHKQSNRRD
jgi:hypothetical protein